MKVVADTDILSIFARIDRLDILKKLFDGIIIPPGVRSELIKGQINIRDIKPRVVRLTRDEVKSLKLSDAKLGRGERECFVLARSRGFPLTSNESIVHSICRKEQVAYFSLPRILRSAILNEVISREEAKQLVKLIEKEENTFIKDQEEIFK
jgi:predicted nucleic acid-binding protein